MQYRLLKILILNVFICFINQQVYAAAVYEPVLLKEIRWTGTSWFGSPIIHDLGTGEPKLIGTFYDIIVWDKDFN
jgi:hypothetical protein